MQATYLTGVNSEGMCFGTDLIYPFLFVSFKQDTTGKTSIGMTLYIPKETPVTHLAGEIQR